MSFFRNLLSKDKTPSLQDQIRRFDDLEALLEDAVRCYKSAIESIGDCTARAPKELAEEHRKQLKRLRGALNADTTKEILEETKKKLHTELTSYAAQFDTYLEQQEQETREVMAIIAVLAESVGARDKQNSVRFRGIGKKLRLLATTADLSEIKRKLNEEIVQLEKYVDEMARDTEKALGRVQAELTTVKSRPIPLLTSDGADVATGLPGRLRGLSEIEYRSQAGVRFCLVRTEIEHFSALQQADGAEAANQVLGQFATLVRDSFRPGDVVCRWGEAELLVVTDVRLPEVAGRMPLLEKALLGPYRVATPTSKKELSVRCASAIVESIHGETANELVRRLEQR